ncbi:type II toxin-antitoxin system RelE/ParE family toxin [Variovorax sp. WS11]|uniref:type II toxin-antitoxin system RelE/ParE family toxin n=1 Tax=Variovorax sp. WS11 TaxID=1105204 RepID=UPI000D0D9410|nr:type II toxin-antitoxin system RelE/ParE family toxin [Variovorax sp. WS11]NDZ13801.1 type II toxin-antitoxin system RelE/ParE family toxin [Variovorax sp. WS11]PSL79422.1 type II toxin-antitoxin system RelE/ParE family toxin [Variovorax sp. WS11]
MSHWIHPEAEAELGDAAVYYATHASRLIAEAFLVEYERVLELLRENQQRGPHGGHGMRVYHFDRFPYTVIYAEDANLGPQIFAIAHQSREPRYWADRR